MKFLLCLTFALAFNLCAQTLTINEETFDFGDINDLAAVSKTVTFKNSGDKTLEISNVKASCGCTTGKLVKKTYEPGEEGSVEITFNPKGKSGKQTKSVRFTSNDPEANVRSVTFTATIASVFATNPSQALFKLADGKYDKTSETITLTNNHSDPLRVLSATSRNENFTVNEFEPFDIASGENASLTVGVKDGFVPERNTYSYVQVRVRIGNEEINKHVRATIQIPRK
ncbi:MAG: hypothetical protein ACI8W8_004330 [Rhodothermales bacterium]|jgi:hypothetical protein